MITPRGTGRTPLFAELRRLFALARQANKPGRPPVAELLGQEQEWTRSRREFLREAAGAAALAGVGGASARGQSPFLPRVRPRSRTPRIAIVGAGLAGLVAAYTLRKAGLAAAVYSGDMRIGGRVSTGIGLMGPGLTAELGGEFIDSIHDDMLALIDEFGLETLDLFGPTEIGLRDAYFFNGIHYTAQQVIEAFQPLAARIAADQDATGFPITFDDHTPEAAAIDRMSLRQYLEAIGATGFVRELLDVAYLGEYGLETDRQSALNLLVLISADTSEGFQIFGASDQRFKIAGGNVSLVHALLQRLAAPVHVGHILRAIHPRGAQYVLTFHGSNGGPSSEIAADFVILAIPFTTLRQVQIRVPLPPIKLKAIRELGYGASSKLLYGVHSRIWRTQGYNGLSFSDQPFQGTWDNSQVQPGQRGGLTVYLGGEPARAVGGGSIQSHAQHFVPGLNGLFPGFAANLNGRIARADWPDNPFIQAGYACYHPGQYTTIAGAEFLPVGNLFFAGEHTSLFSQGYMNGAAETGRRAAEGLLARLGMHTLAATVYSPSVSIGPRALCRIRRTHTESPLMV